MMENNWTLANLPLIKNDFFSMKVGNFFLAVSEDPVLMQQNTWRQVS